MSLDPAALQGQGHVVGEAREESVVRKAFGLAGQPVVEVDEIRHDRLQNAAPQALAQLLVLLVQMVDHGLAVCGTAVERAQFGFDPGERVGGRVVAGRVRGDVVIGVDWRAGEHAET